MKNRLSHQFWIVFGFGIGTVLALDLAITTPSAEAGCHPTGRYAAGRPILNCTGRTRCRPTGRYKIVRGVRYRILNCPR